MVLYLAGIYAVFGHHPLAARIVTALIGTAACYLVYRLGRRLFNVQVGLLAAGLAAVHANHPDRGTSYDFEESAWVAPLPEDIRCS